MRTFEERMVDATQKLWETGQPQTSLYVTDFGKVAITVAYPVDPKAERADDPPIC